ncbi:MAG TPA: PEGA domain-containing protein [Clostridia bacterium]|nr:PEGA domain-containing protein [Clostridia bacterium]
MRSLALIVLLFASTAFGAENPRVFVTDSQSWEVGAGAGGSSGEFGSAGSGGARPQTAEVIKTFHERCSNVILNNRRDKADYIVVLDHEGGKASIRRDNKIAIFNQATGDAIFSRSTRSLGNSIKEGCSAIYQDWSRRDAAARTNADVESLNAPATGAPASPEARGLTSSQALVRVQVSSDPAAADIEVDGAFVGNTPSALNLAPGEYRITVSKRGYTAWQRTLRVGGGNVNLMAELVREQKAE